MRIFKFLFNEADESASAGGPGLETSPVNGDEVQFETGTQTQQEEPGNGSGAASSAPGKSGKPAAPTAPSGMTPADIARAVAETMKEYQPKPAAPAPKQRTIQDVRQELDYYEVDDKVMETLFSVEATAQQRREAFAEVQRKMYAHTLKVAQQLVREHLEEARAEFEPIKTEFQARRQKEQVDAFYRDYPGLAAHKQTVALIANQLPANNPQTGKPFSNEELINNIVVATTSYLKSLGHEIDPKTSTASPNAESNPTGVPKSKPLAGSGRSAPGTSPAPKPVSRDLSIWS